MVVVNPASAGGRTRRRWPGIRRDLRDGGIAVATHLTTAPGDAITVTRQAVGAGFRRIVAVGGDGTLNEVVNGCFQATPTPLADGLTVGLIASGTGSDFRRTLGLSTRPARIAELLAAGTTRVIDVGRVEFSDGVVRHFVNIADCGIGGEIVAAVNGRGLKAGGLLGSMVFSLASLATLVGYRNREVILEVDGQATHRRVQQVVVANGRYFGGGMQIAPLAHLDDGLLDVIVVGDLSRLAAVGALPRLYRGRHLSLTAVEMQRGRRITIQSADKGEPLRFDLEGEQLGGTPATITVVPAALRFAAADTGRDPGRRTIVC
jgi:YegS/Rv2252/BmrU family lipid kinase